MGIAIVDLNGVPASCTPQESAKERTLAKFKRQWPTSMVFIRAACATYLILTIVLRLCFIPEYTFQSKYAAFICLDAMADLFLLFDLISNRRNKFKVHSVEGSEMLKDLATSKDDFRRQSRAPSHQEGNASKLASELIKSAKTIRRSTQWRAMTVSMYIGMIFPLEFFAFAAGVVRIGPYKMNRLVQFFFLKRYLHDVMKVFERAGWIQNISVQRMATIMFYVILVCHFFGCVFYWVSKIECERGRASTWIENDGLAICPGHGLEIQFLESVSIRYLRAVYWAFVTMITTGFGDIVPVNNPETVCVIVAMYFGVLLTTASLSVLTLLMINADAARTEFQLRMDAVNKYMRYRRLPPALQARITSFFDYRWYLLKGVDEREFLDELPPSLKQQVTNMFVRDLLKRLPALKNSNNALLNALSEQVQSNVYSPKDEIIRPGEIEPGTFIVSRGEVEVVDVNKGHQVEQKLKPGDFFAEGSLFVNNCCARLLRAVTFAEVLVLPSVQFQKVLKTQCSPYEQIEIQNAVQKSAESKRKTAKMFGGGADTMVDNLRGYRRLFLPKSRFRKGWVVAIFVGLVFYSISLPLHAADAAGDPSQASWKGHIWLLLAPGLLVDLLFLVDLYLQARCFFFLKEGLLVLDKDEVWVKFKAEHNLYLEALAALPWEAVAAALGARWVHLVRLPKLLRLGKFAAYMGRVQTLMAESEKAISVTTRKFIELNLFMILACHWLGCLWIFCSDLGPHIGYSYTWVIADAENSYNNITPEQLTGLGLYLRGVYWAMVATSTVGYGDIVPQNHLETSYTVFVILFGGLMVPAVVGGLAALIGNMNHAFKEFQKKMQLVRTFTRQKKFPRELRSKIFNYYDYLWTRQAGINEMEILENLSGPLREQVSVCVVGQALKSIPFFADCDDGLQKYMVSVLIPRVFLPKDVIIEAGDIGKEMYVIERGQVMVANRDKSITFAILEEGDYFGEGCLLQGNMTRSATVSSIDYCDCFVLTKEGFNGVLVTYPEYKDMILESLTQVLSDKVGKNRNIRHNFSKFAKLDQVSGMATVDFSQVEDQTKSKVIHPDSTWRHIWNFLIVFVVTWNAFAIPFRLAFHYENLMAFAVDYALDLVLWGDIYLHLFRFGYIYEGQFHTDLGRIRRRYRATHFRLDLLVALPYDLLAPCLWAAGLVRGGELGLALAACRLPKLLLMRGILRHLRYLERACEKMKLSPTTVQLAELLGGVVLVSHWAASGWYMMANFQKLDLASTCRGLDNTEVLETLLTEYTECKWDKTWVHGQIESSYLPPDGGMVWDRYVRSLNWALPTLVVVVIGDTYPLSLDETLYVLCWIIVGMTINATIIGNISNMIANLDVESSEFSLRQDMLNAYMAKHRVSDEIQTRVNQFLSYLWNTHQGAANSQKYVNDLPFSLRMAVSVHSNIGFIKQCPFFDFCSDDIVRALAICLVPQVYSKEDVIVQYGDMGEEMYFIDKGSVDIVSQEGQVFATLVSGYFFGETALFFKQKRSANVIAVEFCEILELKKKDLDNELQQREFDLSRMLDMFTQLQEMNKRRNAAVEKNLSDAVVPGNKLFKMVGPHWETDAAHNINDLFLPNSWFRIVWDVLRLFIISYFMLIIPYRVAFTLPSDMAAIISNHIAWDIAFDVFFIIDIYFQYYKFPYLDNGDTIYDPDKIKENYSKSWLKVEVLASIPFEICAVFFGPTSWSAWRINHLLRMGRVGNYVQTVGVYISRLGVRIGTPTAICMKMAVMYLLINHWYACIWFIIHRYALRNSSTSWAIADGLSTYDESTGQHDILSVEPFVAYNRAFFFVITSLSSVGYGDIGPQTNIETLWEDWVCLTGASIFGAVIGSISTYLASIDQGGENAFKMKMQTLKAYMANRGFPAGLQEAVHLHHQRLWVKNSTLDEKGIMQDLPVPLRMEVCLEVHKAALHAVPILAACSAQTKRRVAVAFRQQVCSPQMRIYDAGDIGWDMYFIASGLVKVRLPTDLTVLDSAGRALFNMAKRKAQALGTLLRRGNHFGESCLTSHSGVRQEKVEASILTELLLISKASLEDILSYLPAHQRQEMINALITRNGNVLHTASAHQYDTKAMNDTLQQNDSDPTKKKDGGNSTSFKTFKLQKYDYRRKRVAENRDLMQTIRVFASAPAHAAVHKPVELANPAKLRPAKLDKDESFNWGTGGNQSKKRVGVKLTVIHRRLEWHRELEPLDLGKINI